MARNLYVSDLRLGAPVRWLGEDSDRDVLLPEHRSAGRFLRHGHLGRLTSIEMPHVQIDWVGLEDEPVSFGVGFGPDPSGCYPSLELLTEAEWSGAMDHGPWKDWG